MNHLILFISFTFCSAAYDPFAPPGTPLNFPSVDSTIFITGALLEDPFIQEAVQYVNERVPDEYLNLEPATFRPDTPNAPTYNAGPEGCLWKFGDCVVTEDTEYLSADIITCPNAGDWGLTYDDGPTSPFSTDVDSSMVVDSLRERNIKATFFPVGYHVAWNEDSRAIIKTMHDEGHELAQHTWTHHPLTALTNEQIVAELLYTEAIIYQAAGVSPKLLRPPYGDADNRVRAIAKALGISIVFWTDDSEDTRDDSEGVLDRIRTWYNRAGPGRITLQHDGDTKTVQIALNALEQLPRGQLPMRPQPVGTCLGFTSFYKDFENPPERPPVIDKENLDDVEKKTSISDKDSSASEVVVSLGFVILGILSV